MAHYLLLGLLFFFFFLSQRENGRLKNLPLKTFILESMLEQLRRDEKSLSNICQFEVSNKSLMQRILNLDCCIYLETHFVI